jgi:hypothetical protein
VTGVQTCALPISGRREKEAAEDALLLWMMRHFRKQAKKVKERAQYAKAVYVDDIFAEMDEEELAQLTRLLLKNARGGITLFGAATGLAIDYTMTNLEAANWARQYAGKLIKDIDAYSLEVVRKAVTMFVETPGWTMGDLVSDLMSVFGEKRADALAVTEVTRSYSSGNQMAGEAMKDQFPDVPVKKRWFTNNDYTDGKTGLCDYCAELDGMEVDIDENFYEPENEYQDGNPPYHYRCRCWISTYTALAELD